MITGRQLLSVKPYHFQQVVGVSHPSTLNRFHQEMETFTRTRSMNIYPISRHIQARMRMDAGGGEEVYYHLLQRQLNGLLRSDFWEVAFRYVIKRTASCDP